MPVSGCTCVRACAFVLRVSKRTRRTNERTNDTRNTRHTNLLEHFVDVRGVRVRARLATTLLVAVFGAAAVGFAFGEIPRKQATKASESAREHARTRTRTQSTTQHVLALLGVLLFAFASHLVSFGVVVRVRVFARCGSFQRASESPPTRALFQLWRASTTTRTPHKQENTMSGRGKAASGAKAKAASGAKKATKSNSRR